MIPVIVPTLVRVKTIEESTILTSQGRQRVCIRVGLEGESHISKSLDVDQWMTGMTSYRVSFVSRSHQLPETFKVSQESRTDPGMVRYWVQDISRKVLGARHLQEGLKCVEGTPFSTECNFVR